MAQSSRRPSGFWALCLSSLEFVFRRLLVPLVFWFGRMSLRIFEESLRVAVGTIIGLGLALVTIVASFKMWLPFTGVVIKLLVGLILNVLKALILL